MNETTLEVDRLRNYFRLYNEQVKQVPGISGLCEIDVSGGLGSIVASVFNSSRWNESGFIPNNYTCRHRNEFCIEVLIYFLNTGNVPEFNANEVIQNAREKLPYPIGKSFEAFSNSLKELRGVKEISIDDNIDYSIEDTCE